MSWILKSMKNEIGENFMYYDNAKEMWDAFKEMNSNMDNTFFTFEVKSLFHDLKHGNSFITNYFNNLSRHWQQSKTCEKVE